MSTNSKSEGNSMSEKSETEILKEKLEKLDTTYQSDKKILKTTIPFLFAVIVAVMAFFGIKTSKDIEDRITPAVENAVKLQAIKEATDRANKSADEADQAQQKAKSAAVEAEKQKEKAEQGAQDISNILQNGKLDELKTLKVVGGVWHASPEELTDTSSTQGIWEPMNGMEIELDLKYPAELLIIYSVNVAAMGDGTGSWVAIRTILDEEPILTSGRHIQPIPNASTPRSLDGIMGAQETVSVEAGKHSVSLQWRSNVAIWGNYANKHYDPYGGVSGRALTVIAFYNISDVIR